MNTGRNGGLSNCSPSLRITAGMCLSEELRHKARHKHERKPRARGAMLVWVDLRKHVYVAHNAS